MPASGTQAHKCDRQLCPESLTEISQTLSFAQLILQLLDHFEILHRARQ